MNGWTVALITTALIIASAFFVIVEFALLAARRHRLEEDAPAPPLQAQAGHLHGAEHEHARSEQGVEDRRRDPLPHAGRVRRARPRVRPPTGGHRSHPRCDDRGAADS